MSEYDKAFESMRLLQLQKQLLSADRINGKIVFGCLPGNHRIDFASWFFDDEQMTKLRGNGFRDFIQPLIEVLAEYRQSYNITPNRDAKLEVVESNLSLKWLADDSAEMIIDSFR